MLFEQRAGSRSFFNRIEIGALHVFQDCKLDSFAGVRLTHDGCDELLARETRGTSPALSCNDFIIPRLERVRANDDRREQTVRADRLRELRQRFLVEMLARLIWLRA